MEVGNLLVLELLATNGCDHFLIFFLIRGTHKFGEMIGQTGTVFVVVVVVVVVADICVADIWALVHYKSPRAQVTV